MTPFKPQFATASARAKVDQLMQPALIRVIDNIRKQLDLTDWQGKYEETLIWPDGTTSEQQQEYAALQKLLHGVPPKEHDRVATLISRLPQPVPLYTLRLTKANLPDQTVDIWAMCYRVCALDAAALEARADSLIEADSSLFDDTGEVDWQRLDDKTKALIEHIFQTLPT
ncbi:MAG: hypothetical protein WBA76_14925 [Phormidesmis sp.]